MRALLLQVLYTIRSERMLMEQLEYNLLFRWFVGLNMDEPVWVPTVFSKNRDRLLNGDIAEKFFAQVLKQARANDLLSDEHFSVDGTLIEAWASQKSFQRKDQGPTPPPEDPGNPTVDFHGEERRNDTHALDDRSGGAAGTKKWRPRVEAGLLRQRADREPQRTGGGHRTGAVQRHGRARRRSGNGGADRWRPTRDGGRRQRL